MPKRPSEPEMDDVSQARTQNATESDLADGEYRDAVDDMYERVKIDLKAWKDGLTQHFPVK